MVSAETCRVPPLSLITKSPWPETGTPTLVVVGFIMLLAGLGWLLFVGWDIRAGNMFMQVLFGVDVFLALVLITVGMRKKVRQKK